jgi:hypothetical protein
MTPSSGRSTPKKPRTAARLPGPSRWSPPLVRHEQCRPRIFGERSRAGPRVAEGAIDPDVGVTYELAELQVRPASLPPCQLEVEGDDDVPGIADEKDTAPGAEVPEEEARGARGLAWRLCERVGEEDSLAGQGRRLAVEPLEHDLVPWRGAGRGLCDGHHHPEPGPPRLRVRDDEAPESWARPVVVGPALASSGAPRAAM